MSDDNNIISFDWYKKQKADTPQTSNEYYIGRLIEICQTLIHEIEELKSRMRDLERATLDMERVDD